MTGSRTSTSPSIIGQGKFKNFIACGQKNSQVITGGQQQDLGVTCVYGAERRCMGSMQNRSCQFMISACVREQDLDEAVI